MFGIKTRIIKKINSTLSFKLIEEKWFLPIKPMLTSLVISSKLKRESQKSNVQNPVVLELNFFAKKLAKNISKYMPNNLGNWTTKKPISISSYLEKQVIEFILHKYKAGNNIGGHFGSGSTEGNIHAVWVGRNYLRSKIKDGSNNNIILIKSCLAHYSIDKAADICGVNILEASIDQAWLRLDLLELSKLLENQYKKGVKGFLLPATLGYTISGTDDDIKGICELVKEFKEKHNDSYFFVWIDAAFSGFNKIYVEDKFNPFQHDQIQLITFDFHKALAVPYPSNLILYRKKLIKYIAKKIPYIDQLDTTLLGSRNGNDAIYVYYSIVSFGKSRIKEEIIKSIEQKQLFLEKIKKEKLNLTIINNKHSNQACLVLSDKKTKNTLLIKYKLESNKYYLKIKGKIVALDIVKLYFLPKYKKL